jgi:hypothetical protein
MISFINYIIWLVGAALFALTIYIIIDFFNDDNNLF